MISAALLTILGCDPGSTTNPDGGGPSPGALGAICARNADCNSGLCLAAGRCTDVCTSLAECPESWACEGLAGSGLVCQCNATSSTEICNGVDDECDGRIDNGATCPGGTVCEGGTCLCAVADRCDGECVDHTSDARHCGGCGNACPSGQVCEAGTCMMGCSASSTRCGDACVNLVENTNHCGGCGVSCGAGGVCEGGICACAGELQACGDGACVDVDTDVDHCGSCGSACDPGELCDDGYCDCAPGLDACFDGCFDFDGDEGHCGDCSSECAAGQACVGGACTTPAERNCSDGLDGDDDGSIDGADSDCALPAYFPPCAAGESLRVYPATGIPAPFTDGGSFEVDIPTTAGVIRRAAVLFDATHTYDGDVELYLLTGTIGLQVPMIVRRGGEGDDFASTIFDSTCSATSATVTPPFAACIQPQQTLGGLEGLTLPLTYRFRVVDTSSTDTGVVSRLALVICAAP